MERSETNWIGEDSTEPERIVGDGVGEARLIAKSLLIFKGQDWTGVEWTE